MSVSRSSVVFAVFIYAAYQAGIAIAYRYYPSALLLMIFPPWLAALGFAFVTFPVAYAHSAIVGCFVRRSPAKTRVGVAIVLSTAAILPAIMFFVWLDHAAVRSSFGDMTGMIVPDDAAFERSSAIANFILKYSISFLIPAWGTTLLMLRPKSRAVHVA